VRHHHHRRRMRDGFVATRIGLYMRARLRRRIFWWFGATIVLAFLVAGATMSVLGQGNASWHREVERARALVSHSFERVWESPEGRESLARSIAQDLEADITLRDATGARILVVGRACEHPALVSPVRTRGLPAGDVSVCLARERQHGGARMFLAFGAAGLVLWAISGRIARRLARPFDQLASIAGEIGGGRLGARIALDDCRDEDVAVVGRVMNDMAARIEKQLADQRELLAAVSHEIRTPLSRVRILTELGRDGADAQKTFDGIDAEVMEIDALVSELLASARLDFAAAKPIDLDAVDAAKRALERASVDASLLDAPEPLTVHADPTLLARALANLLDNAQRHAGAVDRLSVIAEDDRVRFAVLDRGPGLAPGDETKIFDSFYRGARGRDDAKKPSLGLGLALVRRIAEAHGGRVSAESRAGGGAIIAIELPRVG